MSEIDVSVVVPQVERDQCDAVLQFREEGPVIESLVFTLGEGVSAVGAVVVRDPKDVQASPPEDSVFARRDLSISQPNREYWRFDLLEKDDQTPPFVLKDDKRLPVVLDGNNYIVYYILGENGEIKIKIIKINNLLRAWFFAHRVDQPKTDQHRVILSATGMLTVLGSKIGLSENIGEIRILIKRIPDPPNANDSWQLKPHLTPGVTQYSNDAVSGAGAGQNYLWVQGKSVLRPTMDWQAATTTYPVGFVV